MTMPTIRPASKTSRKTINSAASTATSRRNFQVSFPVHSTTGNSRNDSWHESWHDQKALGLVMEVVVKIVAARLLRPHINDGFAADRDDLLEMQVAAFELGDDRIEILDVDRDGLTGRRMQFGGIELMILDGDRKRDCVIRARAGAGAAGQQCRAEQQQKPPADPQPHTIRLDWQSAFPPP